MVFNESVKLNTNGHDFINKNTVKSLLKIPAIQGEVEFYKFLQQRFENQYEQFIIKQWRRKFANDIDGRYKMYKS